MIAQEVNCTNCDALLRTEDRYCGKCGKAVFKIDNCSFSKKTLALAVLATTLFTGALLLLMPSLIGKTPLGVHNSKATENSALTLNNEIDDDNIKQLKKELEINPNSKDVLKELVQKLWEKLPNDKEPNQALVLELLDNLSRITAIDPNDSSSLLMLANLTFNQRVFDKSSEFYLRYLTQVPDDIQARASYSSALTFIGKFKEALEELDLILQKDPKLFQANAYKAITLAQMGKIEEAKKIGSAALLLAPNEESKEKFQKFIASLDQKENTKLIDFLKNHPIISTKILKLDDSDPKVLKLYLKQFPMSAMPAIAKEAFFGKIKVAKVNDIKSKITKLEFYDVESNSLMDTVNF